MRADEAAAAAAMDDKIGEKSIHVMCISVTLQQTVSNNFDYSKRSTRPYLSI